MSSSTWIPFLRTAGDSHRCEVVVVARDAARLLEKSDVGALQKRDAPFNRGSEGGRRLRVHGRVRECDSFLRAGLNEQVDHRGGAKPPGEVQSRETARAFHVEIRAALDQVSGNAHGKRV